MIFRQLKSMRTNLESFLVIVVSSDDDKQLDAADTNGLQLPSTRVERE